jgi:murein DD-endopeptidase MepM/ murein hydrolase activator NlpD
MNRWRVAVVIALLVSTLPSSATALSRYTFPVQGCSVTFSRYHHNYPATDILAKVGCAFVAPTSGVIDEVNRIDRFSWSTNKGADRGGKMISMIGDDGVRYYGSHLYSVRDVIQPGLRVDAGYLLGRVGQTGDARGTASHLHFGISWPTKAGIWWVRRGELNPFDYITAWKVGKNISPAPAVEKLRAELGDIPKQTGY